MSINYSSGNLFLDQPKEKNIVFKTMQEGNKKNTE